MDLSLIQQLLPSLPLELILNPKLPPPHRFPLKAGVTEADLKSKLAGNQWESITEPEEKLPAKDIITARQLMLICPKLKRPKAEEIVTVFNEILPIYGMDHVDYLEEFIPNIAVECQEFSKFEENLSYSADRLMVIFKKYYKTRELAIAEQYRPQLIANRVYGGRMGNTAFNDGYDNRGSGAMHLTGKAVMIMYGKYKGLDPVKVPHILRTELKYALDSACWFFSVYKSLKDEALADKFYEVCTKINGGENGLDDREIYHGRTIKVLSAA